MAGITLMGAGTLGSPAGAFADTVSGSPATTSGAVAPASAGSNNTEDVWLDNIGNPPGSGHSQDPHLNCADINVWGNGLSESSGSYIVDGWAPSGSGEQEYPTSGTGTWSYDQSNGGDQVIAVIHVDVLIGNAIADGDTPGAQGYHFKLQYAQNPEKHKTFWVICGSTTTTSSTTSSSQSTTSSTSQSTSLSTSTSSTSQSTSSTSQSTSSSSSSSTTSSTVSTPTTTSSDTTFSQTTSSQSSTGLTTTVTDPSTSTSSSSSTASSSSSTASNPSTGVLGASTTTPSTGADVEFGFGIALLLGGAGVMIGATRVNRGKRQ